MQPRCGRRPHCCHKDTASAHPYFDASKNATQHKSTARKRKQHGVWISAPGKMSSAGLAANSAHTGKSLDEWHHLAAREPAQRACRGRRLAEPHGAVAKRHGRRRLRRRGPAAGRRRPLDAVLVVAFLVRQGDGPQLHAAYALVPSKHAHLQQGKGHPSSARRAPHGRAAARAEAGSGPVSGRGGG